VRPGCLLTSLFFSAALGGQALADDKADCLAAASKGQTQRDAHALVEARDQFRLCARAQCPAVVQASCIEWLEVTERSLPTIVLSAKEGAGADLIDVKASIDGVVVATRLEGKAIDVNPGLHSFRFELGSGKEVAEDVVIKEGEKDHAVVAIFPAAPPPIVTPARAPSPALAASPPPAPPGRDRGSLRAKGAVALAGAGALAAGLGAYFGAEALSKNGEARPYCGVGGVKNACYGAGVTLRDDAVRDATASTVLLSAGGAGIVAGLVLWLTAPRPPSATTVGFDGRMLRLETRF
jgi:hypothetical protein